MTHLHDTHLPIHWTAAKPRGFWPPLTDASRHSLMFCSLPPQPKTASVETFSPKPPTLLDTSMLMLTSNLVDRGNPADKGKDYIRA